MVNLLCSGSWYQPPVSAAHTPCLSSCSTWDAMPAESGRNRARPGAQHPGAQYTGADRCAPVAPRLPPPPPKPRQTLNSMDRHSAVLEPAGAARQVRAMSKGRRIFPSCSARAAQGCSRGSAPRPPKSARELSSSLSLVAGTPPAFFPESLKSEFARCENQECSHVRATDRKLLGFCFCFVACPKGLYNRKA